jgi:hypothetical protein
VGGSRLGKTEWARSLGPATYMCNMFNLDEWNEDDDTLILDDLDFKYLPSWKALFGSQKCFNVTEKYRKKRRVYGKLLIWCCNHANDPSIAVSGTELEWYRANVVTVYINEPLF